MIADAQETVPRQGSVMVFADSSDGSKIFYDCTEGCLALADISSPACTNSVRYLGGRHHLAGVDFSNN
jgi:hypothetical protein